MTFYFCKMCGRSGRFDRKPNFCYFDRMDAIEDVSDEDSVKMGLNIPDGEVFEFPGDVRWDPFTGKKVRQMDGLSLRQFQEQIMEMVND